MDIKAVHYYDKFHVRQILDCSELALKGEMELTAVTIRGLILTVSNQGEIGKLYPQILETLMRNAYKLNRKAAGWWLFKRL